MSNEDVELAFEIQIDNVLHLVPITLLFWDHLVTLDAEILYCWKQPKSLSSILFFVNRYLSFFGNISFLVLANIAIDSKSCRRVNHFHQFFLLITQALVCFLLLLRVYALYGCNRRVIQLLSGIVLILTIASCVSLILQTGTPPTERRFGCHSPLSSIDVPKVAAPYEALVIYDAIIFGFTIYKTGSRRHWFGDDGDRIPLVTLVLRDGAIYFAVMALANLSNILTLYFAAPIIKGGLSTFSSSVSVAMVSRLMLNLHQSASSSLEIQPGGQSTVISTCFHVMGQEGFSFGSRQAHELDE